MIDSPDSPDNPIRLPRKPARVFRSDVRMARLRVGDAVRVTPVFHTEVTGPRGPVKVTFKLEYLQLGGTFKVRGSLNALLEAGDDGRPAVIASGGNAGIAAALACAMRGRACTVVVPESAPHTKVAAMWAYGAEVLWHGTSYAEAYRHANELATERGALQLHAYDLAAVVAGAGVVGLEIERQVRGRPPVLVAVGGGGLLAGIAAAFGPRGRVIGVEPKGAPTLHAALAAGRPVDVRVNSIAADALGATRVGDIAWNVAKRYDVGSVLVTDDAIAVAREYLWREFRIVVEAAGATALAAIQSGAYLPAPGERPVIVLCGANTDLATL
ncbi:serine/threonine dehydratase [Nocardia stercoris]|uniref:Pyridoxal-phosphate dependent enzyme n=1 Tax=Nocardia stercoris TaxID=2483361 RepID=A0A3M2LDL2_9NOCA|nr:serine/threonine dehydratase [Nocardia stercoris]RMI32788.1 pyridoxal-phosphate dependent enzyme [Nocardia stercoris]